MAKRVTSTKSRQSKKSPQSTSSRPRTTKKATKKSPAKKASSTNQSAGDEEVSIDRRRGARRTETTAATSSLASERPKLERRKKVNRRRQIDPTTCERDYSQDEIEFMSALDDYKRANGRMFPTCSEVLEVIRNLGYVKLSPSEMAQPLPKEQSPNGYMEQDEDEDEDFGNEMAVMAIAGGEVY